MSVRYPASVIRAGPVVPTFAVASGLWSLPEALQARQQGIWPRVEGNDSFTKVLVHFDGSDAATTITDVCAGATAHTFTANGNAQLDTGVSPKFGTAYGLFDGTGDYWSTPDNADLEMGSSAFTVDCWVLTGSGNGNRRVIAGKGDGGDGSSPFWIEINASNRFDGYVSNGTATTGVSGTTSFTTAVWHHVAFVRTGNTLKLFVDGVQEGGDISFTGTLPDNSTPLSIGRLGSLATLTMNGGVDEFRLSIGIARWTANFTPPTIAYGPG